MVNFPPILPDRIATVGTRLSDRSSELLEEELSVWATYAPRRQAEFSTGRFCARAGMRAQGLPLGPVLSDIDGVPQFPIGITGSITHKDALCFAAVGRQAEFQSVGIDIERVETLSTEVLRRFLRQEDMAALEKSGLPNEVAVAVAWAAKEAFFKCVYPVVRRRFGMLDARVCIFGNTCQVEPLIQLPLDSRLIRGKFAISGMYAFAGFWWQVDDKL